MSDFFYLLCDFIVYSLKTGMSAELGVNQSVIVGAALMEFYQQRDLVIFLNVLTVIFKEYSTPRRMQVMMSGGMLVQ